MIPSGPVIRTLPGVQEFGLVVGVGLLQALEKVVELAVHLGIERFLRLHLEHASAALHRAEVTGGADDLIPRAHLHGQERVLAAHLQPIQHAHEAHGLDDVLRLGAIAGVAASEGGDILDLPGAALFGERDLIALDPFGGEYLRLLGRRRLALLRQIRKPDQTAVDRRRGPWRPRTAPAGR